jgi:hypothetical protein
MWSARATLRFRQIAWQFPRQFPRQFQGEPGLPKRHFYAHALNLAQMSGYRNERPGQLSTRNRDLALRVHIVKLSKTKLASRTLKGIEAKADKTLGESTSTMRVEGGINHGDRRGADGPACFGAFFYDAFLVAQARGASRPEPYH